MKIIAQEITRNIYDGWPSKSLLTTSNLSKKYIVLHKIWVTNWAPTNHGSSITPSIASLLYQIGTRETFDFGEHVVGVPPSPQNFSYKLFARKHVTYIILSYLQNFEESSMTTSASVLEVSPMFVLVRDPLLNVIMEESKALQEIIATSITRKMLMILSRWWPQRRKLHILLRLQNKMLGRCWNFKWRWRSV